jgi:hypothetical protein
VYFKRVFDATNVDDLKLAQEFLKTGRWEDGCPFIESWPYTTVPEMIKTEIALNYLPKIIKEKSSKKFKKRV